MLDKQKFKSLNNFLIEEEKKFHLETKKIKERDCVSKSDVIIFGLTYLLMSSLSAYAFYYFSGIYDSSFDFSKLLVMSLFSSSSLCYLIYTIIPNRIEVFVESNLENKFSSVSFVYLISFFIGIGLLFLATIVLKYNLIDPNMLVPIWKNTLFILYPLVIIPFFYSMYLSFKKSLTKNDMKFANQRKLNNLEKIKKTFQQTKNNIEEEVYIDLNSYFDIELAESFQSEYPSLISFIKKRKDMIAKENGFDSYQDFKINELQKHNINNNFILNS